MSGPAKLGSAVVAPPRDDGARAAGAARPEGGASLEIEILDSVRARDAGPIEPARLEGGDRLRFSCHAGVACWNACCHDTDITLTPLDILRRSSRLRIRPAEFLSRFAVPAVWNRADLPVAKLRIADTGGEKKPCVFLDDEIGCTVYEDRPASCRYYPLGLARLKMKGHETPEDFYFLVREPHCKGHLEPVESSVDEFRRLQDAIATARRDMGAG